MTIFKIVLKEWFKIINISLRSIQFTLQVISENASAVSS